jgi:hypothetical protein
MSPRIKRTILLVLALALLAGTGFVQKAMNRDRERLGLTRVEPLKNAPPVLAFTTVALGGFRGLISNALWIRASELQDEDKFFEMAQLADWITKLEPHFVQVWLVQAWNMSYNISVKFKDYPDRWRWVQRGIALLRDEGLAYNPNEILIYRELAWQFQHKMGANLDDASLYYKHQWALEMSEFFGKKEPNIQELVNPTTPEASNRVYVLKTKYKMDPDFLKEVDDRYGPLEWRLPESHAVYWAALGLKAARENPSKVKKEDLMTLRRVIYQSMQMSFHRGRLVRNPFSDRFEFGPNLDIVQNVSDAYLQAAEEEPNSRDHILTAHRNFLRDAVYFLYTDNRMAEAMKWFRYIAEKYPNKQMLDGRPETLPGKISLDEYAVARVQTDVEETDRNRIQAHIEGLLANSYYSLIVGQDGRYEGLQHLAQRVWEAYMSKVPPERMQAIGLRPYVEIRSEVLARLLDTEKGLPPEARAILRTQLNLPAEQAPAAPTAPNPQQQTNSPALPAA